MPNNFMTGQIDDKICNLIERTIKNTFIILLWNVKIQLNKNLAVEFLGFTCIFEFLSFESMIYQLY